MPNTPTLKEEKNQPSLNDFIQKNSKNKNTYQSPDIATERKENKKRTPPSPHCQPRNKKTNYENNMDVDTESLNPKPTEISSSDSEDEEEMPILDEKSQLLLKATTIAMNRSIKKVLKKKLKPLKQDMKSLLGIQDSMAIQQEEIASIKAENQELKTICSRMEIEQNQLKLRITKLEDRRLECNLIFNGIPETVWESDDELKEKIYSAMSTTVNLEDESKKLEQAKKVKITSVKRLGKPVDNKRRPVQVIYDKANEALMMLNNKKKLPKGTYVDQEYSADTEKARRQLRPILNAARKHDAFKNKSKMDGDSIIINSKRYTTDNLHDLPEQLVGYNLSGKSDDSVVAFFGNLNPFSNFHPCEFHLDNITYHSSEQYIQLKKAEYFKDYKTAEKLLNTKNGPECKKLSKEINNYVHDQWKQVAKQISEPGITAKYFQNPRLMRVLASTDKRTLVESSKDSLWGTGIPLQSTDALDKNKWKNVGILGEILMNIRDTWGKCAIPGADIDSINPTISTNRSARSVGADTATGSNAATPDGRTASAATS